MPEKTNQVKIIRQNKWYRLWVDPRNFNPNDPLSFEHGFDISLSVYFDNDTLAKNNDNRYEIAPRAFSIKENIVKFKTGETMAFKDFWNACLDKINGLISSVSKNEGNISAEIARATDAEKVLRDAIAALEKATVNKTTLPDVVVGVELENRPEVVNIKVKSRKTDGGQDTVAIFPMPVANGEHIGLMNPETFRTVAEHEKRLAAIEGRAERWPIRLPETGVSQEEYQAAYEQVAGVPAGTVPPDGTMLDNLTNNHLIKYYANTPVDSSDHWIDRGMDTVSQASNDTAGIVKGDAKTPGKVFVEGDGSMSVNGWDKAIAEVRAAAENAAENARVAGEQAGNATKAATNAANDASSAATSAETAKAADVSAQKSADEAKDNEVLATRAAADAREWATKMNGSVVGDDYSAKHYATSAAASESGAKNSERNAFDSATAAHNDAESAASSATNAAASATAASASAASAQQNEQLLQEYVNQAATSATTAQASATSATNSANAAATSANESAGSAANARKSELAAANSASAAGASATSANNSQVSASESADSAAVSATSASEYATGAAKSATDAAASATSAAQSEQNTTASASAAAQSASQAAASAQQAATSATNLSDAVSAAQDSANLAADSASTANTAKESAKQTADELIEYLERTKNEFATRGQLASVYKILTGPRDYGFVNGPASDGEELDFGVLQ